MVRKLVLPSTGLATVNQSCHRYLACRHLFADCCIALGVKAVCNTRDTTKPSGSTCNHQQHHLFEIQSVPIDKLLAIRLKDPDPAPLSKVEQW